MACVLVVRISGVRHVPIGVDDQVNGAVRVMCDGSYWATQRLGEVACDLVYSLAAELSAIRCAVDVKTTAVHAHLIGRDQNLHHRNDRNAVAHRCPINVGTPRSSVVMPEYPDTTSPMTPMPLFVP